MTATPNLRALCAELVNELHGYKALHPEHGTDLIDRACRELATPPPAPPTDEERLALQEKLWGKYKTIPYQGEEFMYGDAFESALSDYRAALERWGHR